MDGATFFCTADRIGFDLEESETKNRVEITWKKRVVLLFVKAKLFDERKKSQQSRNGASSLEKMGLHGSQVS